MRIQNLKYYGNNKKTYKTEVKKQTKAPLWPQKLFYTQKIRDFLTVIFVIKNNMEKDYGKIAKNANTSVVIRVDDFGGKPGLTIREFVNGTDGGYSGFTKSGTRIPADKFLEFREVINSIPLEDFKASAPAEPKDGANPEYEEPKAGRKSSKKKVEEKAAEPVEDY